jgi:hypothetical protein
MRHAGPCTAHRGFPLAERQTAVKSMPCGFDVDVSLFLVPRTGYSEYLARGLLRSFTANPPDAIGGDWSSLTAPGPGPREVPLLTIDY